MKRFLTSTCLLSLVIIGALYITRFHTYDRISPVRGEFITIEDQSIYITDQGEGQVVIFLPGFLIHSDTWFEIASHPPQGYRYITIDWPGSGFSKKNTATIMTPTELSMTLKLIMDKLNIKQSVLVGFELGGGVAMVTAARYPNLVKGLILIAPDSSYSTAATIFGAWWHVPVINVIYASLCLDRGFVRRYIKRCWGQSNDQWRTIVERYHLPLTFQDAKLHFLKNHIGRRAFHYLPYEERIDVKTKIIWGEVDRINASKNGQVLANSLVQADLSILPNVGHLPQEENPEAIKSLINTFLESLSIQKSRDNIK